MRLLIPVLTGESNVGSTLSCWSATVCGAPVAARPNQLEIGFFVQGKLLRLVFDTVCGHWSAGLRPGAGRPTRKEMPGRRPALRPSRDIAGGGGQMDPT